MSNPKHYSIGWICAVSTEYVAAEAFLDEKHDAPAFVSRTDNNIYTLGRMGKHNVVIAVLPDGEYGNASAVKVATDMLHSFPNIRIGLVVGIGGGAPSEKHDIRLGDVIISAALNGKGAVVQHNFGYSGQDHAFPHTPFLNQPPSLLRAAVSGLKKKHSIDGHQLEQAVNAVLDRKPRLRQEFKRPSPSSDRLYRSDFVHAKGSGDCTMSCGDAPSNLITRRKRTALQDDPAIHYGMIASADHPVSDASIRDKMAAESDILCFETVAAGLMNIFPCIVIRGICDYSDSHRNKEWQGFAAMIATAYAKDLLGQIAPSKVETERKMSEARTQGSSATFGTRLTVPSITARLDGQGDVRRVTPVDLSS